uniref:Uncharacterized protein n=1 Tax=Amphora coffeiformis TaxID=265554 RepID=A0A7S3LCW8_9STRA|mmetsp:Transcript_6310/g.12626  ORF Transcript_6310/g.12626 Transcript_6310/m.12626 type:complete len:117 (+) Transcript_6310:124-474(+)|eukprot:scaffold34618_cov159-Amphora_coffeaeformis.AAC.7
MVVTRRSTSPSLSEGSTISVPTSTASAAGKKVVFAATPNETEESSSMTSNKWRRRNFPKPPKKMFKGTSHIHFHKKAPSNKNKGSTESNDVVQRVKLMTGTLYIYKGRKAEFVRTK